MKRGAVRGKIDFIDPVCVECGGLGKLTNGAALYPDKPEWKSRMYYRCGCGASVSCHPGTGIAAGRPASAATRYLRSKAHDVFDPIWRGLGQRSSIATGHARTRAYKWLARQLGIHPRTCHIGFFGPDELRRVIDICNQAAGKEAA